MTNQTPEFPGVDLGMLADGTAPPPVPGSFPLARTVKVKVVNIYGADRVYPANPDAFRFARIAGKKTFSPGDLDAIRELGYEITIATESARLPDGYGHATVI